MDHQENVSFEGLGEFRQGSSGAGLKWLSSAVLPYSQLKWLGMLLVVAQQFTIASADGVCQALSNFGGSRKFDLIGLVSTFGTSAATKSLSYSALNDTWFYLTGHIGPGSLGVAAMLFDATGFRLAHLLSLGGEGDAYAAARLGAPQGLRYVGLKSYTTCPVINAVGASIVRQHEALWDEQEGSQPCGFMGGLRLPTLNQKGRDKSSNLEAAQVKAGGGRDAKRNTKVIILEVERNENQRVLVKASKVSALLLGWVPLLATAGVITGCCLCEEWFVAGLIIWGTIAMIIAVVGLRLFHFTYSDPKVAADAPVGDCLVVDDTDGNSLHIIVAHEREVQVLFQRKIDCKACPGNYLLFLAAAMLYVYVVGSVLYLPNESTRGQILFAIANLIGLLADVLKASKDGNVGLAKKAREQFRVRSRRPAEFKNRTAAMAFVAQFAEERGSLRSKHLLPCEGPVWERWWDLLPQCGREVDFDIIHSCAAAKAEAEAATAVAAETEEQLLRTLLLALPQKPLPSLLLNMAFRHQKLLITLLSDMATGLQTIPPSDSSTPAL